MCSQETQDTIVPLRRRHWSLKLPMLCRRSNSTFPLFEDLVWAVLRWFITKSSHLPITSHCLCLDGRPNKYARPVLAFSNFWNPHRAAARQLVPPRTLLSLINPRLDSRHCALPMLLASSSSAFCQLSAIQASPSTTKKLSESRRLHFGCSTCSSSPHPPIMFSFLSLST